VPVILVSPDTAIDLASVVYDVAVGDMTSLTLDVVSLIIPGVTGIGALSHADEAYDALHWMNNADTLSDAAHAFSGVDNLSDAFRYGDDFEVQLFGFRGLGKRGEQFIDAEPLIYAGHVGVSLDNGKVIYGFSPYAPELTSREVIDALKRHEFFPGQVLDDTAVFHRAQDLAEQGMKTQVYVKKIFVSEKEFKEIRKMVANDLLESLCGTKNTHFQILGMDASIVRHGRQPIK
jgi:hypothetical protein